MYNIFVGNLSFSTTREQLKQLFEPFGAVANVLIMERKKGKSRGYGFVEMPSEEEKNKAIAALEGKEFMFRILHVAQVVPKAPKPHRPKKTFLPSKKGASDVWLTENEERPRPSKPWEKPAKDFAKKNPYAKPFRREERSASTDERPRSSKPWSKTTKDSYSQTGSKNSYAGGYKGKFNKTSSSKPYRPKDANDRREQRSDARPERSGPRTEGGKPFRKDAKSGKSGGWSKDKHDSFSQATGKSGFKKFNPLGGKPRTPRTGSPRG